MRTPADHVVVCPVTIGRHHTLEALDRAIASTVTRQGQVIAISGEAGLGKSRLVAEAQRRAADSQLRVMRGQCFEPDASIPYAPIIDLLRACIATKDLAEVVDCLGPDAPEIVKILPDLTSLILGLQPAPATDPEQEKRRILHGLCQFFARAAASEPLLVVVEDLHWSDDTSLEFLALLARRIPALPILMILTYRSDEVQPALRDFLVGVDRERLGVEWPLTRLTTAEVSEMITAIFEISTPARPEFIDALYSLTEGNPFFLEEVLKSLVASGDIFFSRGMWDRKPIEELQIPRSVHAAVAARTKHLSDAAGDVLRLAAIAGRRFDFLLLQKLTALDESALLAIFKELIGAQLVVEESADHFAFRHALTQQAIYSDLLARERRSMHRTIGETIREIHGSEIDRHLRSLAHHFYAAEAWDEAYYYCRRVAENAQMLNATRAAMEQYSRAIDAASHLRINVPPAILRSRGQANETLGNFDRARADYEEALSGARAADDRVGEWQGLLDLGFLWSGRDYERSGEYFEGASALADQIGDPRLRARSMNRMGNWLVNVGRPSEGLARHTSALAIFEAERDTLGTAETLDLMGMANGILGDLPACAEAYTRAIEFLRPLGPSLALSSSLASRATYCGPSLAEPVYAALGSLRDALRDADEASQIAEAMSSPAAMAYAAWAGGGPAGASGDIGEAMARTSEGLRLAEGIGHSQWIVGARYTLGTIHLYMLAAEEAREQLEIAHRIAMELGSAWWIGNVTASLALAHLLQRDAVSARSALSAVQLANEEPHNLPERRMRWAAGLTQLAEGDAKSALAIADGLIDNAVGGPREQHIPSLLHLRGDALVALGRHDDAQTALEQAVAGAIQRGAVPFLWQIHRSLGKLHQSQRRADDAQREFSAARDVIDRLATTITDASLRDRFREAATSTLPRPKSVTANQAAKEAFGGLTAREREVAALIAAGLSNRDMAERLVLGERTIETHVGNVLSKLGFTSRAQVAAWAVQRGLTEQS